VKYYVTSGCSFSNDTVTWSTHLKRYIIENELGECYNYGSGGGGIDWTRRSTMQGVLNLLNNGVSNNDIKVIVSWPWRNEWEQPICLSDEETKSFLENKEYQTKFGMANRVYGFNFDKIGFKHIMKETMFESEYLFKYLVSYDDETWWTRCGEYRYNPLIKALFQSREDEYFDGLRVMEYYESILSLQMFLETNSIDYTFFAVKNIQRVTTYKTWEECFKWDKSSEFVTSLDCDCKDCNSARNNGWKGQYKRLISPNLINQKMVYEEYPFIKLIYDQIDWDKWWCYKSDVNDFGGTTECVAEQCDIFSYHNKMEDGILIEHPSFHAWKDWFDNYLHSHLKNKGIVI
jgi:hypothetical protein